MGRKERGAVPDRGEERGSSHVRRPETKQTTFRPSLGLYVASPLLLLYGGWLVYGSFAFEEFDLKALAYGGLLVFCGGFLLTRAYARYRIDGEGIEVRTRGRRDYWRWKEIGGVHGAQVRQSADRVGYTLSQVVVDHDDQILFRLSPWTARRRHLATQIRQRSADA